ncbi:hypothetical protein [Clostridium sp. YIM B02555]|uniref:hypothetical protein n=1 Tax=Clostridium sp. YIM B02555 TaxID=2911968 RepID=UPI001EEDE510|nr:hypothetical protein [Clostridium sp. YIM B02555]
MEEKIKKLEQDIITENEKCQEYLNQGNDLKVKCIPMIIDYCKTKIVKEIENFVKNDIINTNNLGLEKLSEMKKEMNELIKNVENTEDINNSKGTWLISIDFIKNIDFSRDTFDIRFNKSKEIQQNVSKYVKKQLLRIGDLLIKYGYIDENKKSEYSIFHSNFGVSLNDDLYNDMGKYSKIFEEYIKSNEKLFKLEKELGQTKALSLWEQA